jgi:hypothetical protein
MRVFPHSRGFTQRVFRPARKDFVGGVVRKREYQSERRISWRSCAKGRSLVFGYWYFFARVFNHATGFYGLSLSQEITKNLLPKPQNSLEPVLGLECLKRATSKKSKKTVKFVTEILSSWKPPNTTQVSEHEFR